MTYLPLPHTIFLAGRMASGKDSIAKTLTDGHGFTRIAFADAVKRDVAEQNDITVEELEARKSEFRTQLQNWGVGKRNERPDYWISRWEYARSRVAGPVVCTDTRFLNEALFGIQTGGLVVMVDTPAYVREARLRTRDGAFNPQWLNHISETGVDDLPVHLVISGTEPLETYPSLLSASYVFLMQAREAALSEAA